MRIDNMALARQRRFIAEKGIAGALLLAGRPTGRVSYSLRNRVLYSGSRFVLVAGQFAGPQRLLLQIRITGGETSQIYFRLGQTESNYTRENKAAYQFLINPDVEFEAGFLRQSGGFGPSVYSAFITAEYV